jgi:hypothetical protein
MALIPVGEEVEEQLPAITFEGHKAEFIHNEQGYFLVSAMLLRSGSNAGSSFLGMRTG